MTIIDGNKVTITGTFTNPDNDDAALDPSAIYLRIREPDGTIVPLDYAGGDLTRESAGVYSYDHDTTGKPGIHRWYLYSTGNGQAAEQGSFTVERVTVPAS